MIDLALAYSFFTYYLVLVIILRGLTQSFSNKRLANSLIVFVPLFILIIPFSGLSGIYYIRGAVGDLSVITAMLLSSVVAKLFFGVKLLDKNSADYFYSVVFVIGLIFYITSLGLGTFDPYGLSYESLIIPVGLLVGAALLLWKNKYGLAMLLVVPIFAYEAGLLESNNIWDYILDPFLWLYAGDRTFKYFIETIRKQRPA